jgi:hypothetical protein
VIDKGETQPTLGCFFGLSELSFSRPPPTRTLTSKGIVYNIPTSDRQSKNQRNPESGATHIGETLRQAIIYGLDSWTSLRFFKVRP